MTNSANAVLNMNNLKAVFLSNEGAVTGFLAATADGSDLADGGRFADLIVAGFDAGSPQKNAVRQGWFVGSVTQDPYRIGYLAVELAVKAPTARKWRTWIPAPSGTPPRISTIPTSPCWYTTNPTVYTKPPRPEPGRLLSQWAIRFIRKSSEPRYAPIIPNPTAALPPRSQKADAPLTRQRSRGFQKGRPLAAGLGTALQG